MERLTFIGVPDDGLPNPGSQNGGKERGMSHQDKRGVAPDSRI